MKKILLIFCFVSCCFGQHFYNSVPIASGGGVKNFQRVQFVHMYTGSSKVIPGVIAGNCLVAICVVNASATLTVSDGVNTWNTVKNISQAAGSAVTVNVSVALSVASGNTTVSFSGSSSDPSITIIEYSGVTGVDGSGGSDVTENPLVATTITSATDMFVWGWGNETINTHTSQILTPGSISAAQIEFEGSQYSGAWELLNSSVGFAPGTWTHTFTGGVDGVLCVVALK